LFVDLFLKWLWGWRSGWLGRRGRSARLGLFARIPRRLPVRVREPSDGVDHGGDGVGHVGEVDGADFVAGLVVVLVQTEAGYSVGDDALLRQCIVVRALEEALLGVGIADQMGAVFG